MATVKQRVALDRGKSQYYRNLGCLPDGRQPKFYVGRDLQEAERRCLRLQQLWHCVEQEHQARLSRIFTATLDLNMALEDIDELIADRERYSRRPQWDDLTMAAAHAIRQGQDTVTLPQPAGSDAAYVRLLARLNQAYPLVRWVAANTEAHERGEQHFVRSIQEHRAAIDRSARMLTRLAPDAPHEHLHHALDAYIAELEIDAHLSPWHRTKTEQARLLRAHAEDMPLPRLDLKQVETMIRYWRNRPQGKRGRMALATCRNHLIQLRAFFRWLHRHPDYSWRQPDGMADLRGGPIRTAEDLSKRLTAIHVVTYCPEELAILYEYASPLMRLWILLALNCGFAGAETSTLEKDHIFLHQEHPYAGRSGISSTEHDSWIRRLRPKTQVYGEWKLWPETVQGLEWAMARKRRIRTKEPALIVTSTGHRYSDPTQGGNKNSRIRNLWVSLIRRNLKKDHPDFRFLPFKQLRKTGGDLIRWIADGEIEGVYLCHGSPVRSDSLADVYANKPFQKVFDALDKLHDKLTPMWAAVPDAFPAHVGGHHVGEVPVPRLRPKAR